MEDLDGGLPNYVDVNAVQELRDENKKLKMKLEESSAAMEKLQKNYGALDMEFKMLQSNTDLIKRKTERLTQLNAEKDLVLNALKSGRHMRRNVNQCLKNPGRVNYDRAPRRGNNKNKEENGNNKN